jgi:hypothetical protein
VKVSGETVVGVHTCDSKAAVEERSKMCEAPESQIRGERSAAKDSDQAEETLAA